MSGAERAGRRRLPPARRSLGQHFLISDRAAGAVADALGEIDGRAVVEIGPGRGILTRALLSRGARVIGIEIDRRLAAYLRERFAGEPALEVLEADALETSLESLARDRSLDLPLRLAGNIPYGITSPLLRRLLGEPRSLERAVLMLQREVAERLTARPGSPGYGSLTVGVRAVADVTEVRTLSPSKFRPPPRVWSTVVRIDPRPDALPSERLASLERLTKAVFAGRRKQLGRVLRNLGVEPAMVARLGTLLGVAPEGRPDEVSVDGFVRLLDWLDGSGGMEAGPVPRPRRRSGEASGKGPHSSSL